MSNLKTWKAELAPVDKDGHARPHIYTTVQADNYNNARRLAEAMCPGGRVVTISEQR